MVVVGVVVEDPPLDMIPYNHAQKFLSASPIVLNCITVKLPFSGDFIYKCSRYSLFSCTQKLHIWDSYLGANFLYLYMGTYF